MAQFNNGTAEGAGEEDEEGEGERKDGKHPSTPKLDKMFERIAQIKKERTELVAREVERVQQNRELVFEPPPLPQEVVPPVSDESGDGDSLSDEEKSGVGAGGVSKEKEGDKEDGDEEEDPEFTEAVKRLVLRQWRKVRRRQAAAEKEGKASAAAAGDASVGGGGGFQTSVARELEALENDPPLQAVWLQVILPDGSTVSFWTHEGELLGEVLEFLERALKEIHSPPGRSQPSAFALVKGPPRSVVSDLPPDTAAGKAGLQAPATKIRLEWK
uniref:UBX domain-containing protein n=1 Tax=Chromera velia CCMP2878 TaxID=1169474 RepID=A0A0G4ID00_9ALVE|eukprot:Cvel_107.t1-p1 / transcript=Cvel_107.t1 / gene=Cvel_107 / organism=Chromera_velia_CCMP2878 / gene_product=hypothetical protein / transcript_product=hypothetical protein / location=Cvel_scaffold8:122244-124323(-) / protein_length=271 / sequence_SO=supercontig / SO=protein_coding / is_pseudo=false